MITHIPEPLVLSEAVDLENQGRGYDALISNYNAIRNFKFRSDVEGGLDDSLRKQIRNFEARVSEFIKNLKDARKNESESGISMALFYYNQAVGLDFAPSRSLYEKALLERDRNQLATK